MAASLTTNAELIEELASIEHQRWAHWQKYMHEKATKQPDGSLVLPADLVKRWEKQIGTPYDLLSASEKESDREQVNLYLPVIDKFISKIESEF
ncbi:hypothetical protein G3T14_08135 [Methylobacterium sp. BTF04]|uniref:hypothetical protein n=1 Tax=Methylobacterium sp. BTF04 TaxID=2708300 RepID=UPI0013D00BE1|nr:hypothetical protein [Methylobacterium sp. BTF04]NEU12099.1 hypothetical protein [Methylobacterium sp. BTF04]